MRLTLIVRDQLGLSMIDLKDARRLLAKEGWLSKLTPSFRDLILGRTIFRRFDDGAPVYVIGDEPGGMYGVAEGAVRVSLAASDHGPYFVHLLRRGAWIGEGPAIAGLPRIATLAASGTAALLYVSAKDIQAIAQADPLFWRNFVVLLMGHLQLACGAVTDSLLRHHDERLIAVLLRLGGLRNAPLPAPRPVVINASQEELAVMANVARMTAGNTLRALKAAGVIELDYGRVTIVAPEKMQAMLLDHRKI